MRKQTIETVPQNLAQSSLNLLLHYLELYRVTWRWNYESFIQLAILHSVPKKVRLKELYTSWKWNFGNSWAIVRGEKCDSESVGEKQVQPTPKIVARSQGPLPCLPIFWLNLTEIL